MSTKKNTKVGNVIYRNKSVGFTITIPDNWTEVKKSSYQDLGISSNTLFILVVDKFTAVSAIFCGFGQKREFNNYFKNFNKDGDLKILYQGENNLKETSIKQVVILKNDKKIMHNFCLINGMIVDFTINVDPNNRLFDNQKLTNSSSFKMINRVLDSLEIFKPVNPPIYIEKIDDKKVDLDEHVNNENESKSSAEILVEEDCKYRNVHIPEFYLKFSTSDKKCLLTIIDDEIFLKDINKDITLVEKNEELLKKISNLIIGSWDGLVNLKSESLKGKTLLLIKYNSEYIGIASNDKISELYDEIVNIILKKDEKNNCAEGEAESISVVGKTENDDSMEILPEEQQNEETDEEAIDEKEDKSEPVDLEEFTESILDDKTENDNNMEILPEEQQNEETDEKEQEENIDDIKEDKSEPVDLEKFTESILDDKTENDNNMEILPEGQQNELTDEKEQEENIDDIKEDKSEPVNLEEFTESILDDKTENDNNMEILPEEQQNEEKIGEDKENFSEAKLDNLQEYFHNVDGYASFKFLFPENSGEKVIRDFNVFDIVKEEEVMYRVFIFKCDSIEQYGAKLKDWMNKNTVSSGSSIVDEYVTTGKSSEIKTYVLNNDKFYKAIYFSGYLISISGLNNQKRIFYADNALNNVEIGEDSREYIEAYDRKLHSISILKSEGIPYIDELPVIESSYEVNGKTMEEIAKRAIALCISCNFASDIVSNSKKRYLKESKKFFTKLLDKLNVKDCLTTDEKKLFDKMDKNIAIQISWQFEGYAVLLWTLGLIEDLPYPDVLVSPDDVTAFVSACDSYKDFISKCNLRDVNDVLDLTDLTYRYNWYCVDAKINKEEPVINSEVVVERYRALRWMLSPDAKWDNVEINS